MSLDVYLYRTYHVSYDNGKSLEERKEYVFEANITHNLTEMADKAGLYEACWRSHQLHSDWVDTDDYTKERQFEESVKMKAKDILPHLEKGYKELLEKPEYFKQFNASNGWGMYKHFLPWVKEYLEACKEYPEATIWASE